MFREAVLGRLVLAGDTNDCEECVKRYLLKGVEVRVRVSNVHQLVEVKQEDQAFGEFISLESELRVGVAVRQLRYEETGLTRDLERQRLLQELQTYLVDLDVVENPILRWFLAIDELGQKV